MTTESMPSSTPNIFAQMAAIDVGNYIEKKGKLSYLSWAWAVDQLLRRDVTARWSYGEPIMYGATMMVVCTVHAFGIPRTMQLPVMNNVNKPIENPNAFEVNTAMQRCLVKAIALHGLGLYIYAGEDVPLATEPPALTEVQEASLQGLRDASLEGMAKLQAAWKALAENDREALRSNLQALKDAAAKVDNA